MKQTFITPNDPNIICETDSASIQKAVNYAVRKGVNKVLIPKLNKRTGKGGWIIDKSILLPSNITVILDNCHMTLADGAFCNFFRNELCGTEIANTLDGEQHDIHIIGQGYAILDGGNTNWFLECNRNVDNCKTENMGLKINNAILLHNVRDFSIENIEIRNQRWWAINLIYCRNGKVIDFTCMATNIIQNQDGLDIRCGCNNITVERLTGKSGDDLIALTALERSENGFHVSGKDGNIHDIFIKDVLGCSIINGLVVLRNQDSRQIYNVEMENVIQSDLEDLNNHPYTIVDVGQNDYIYKKQSPIGSTRNIKAKTIIGDSSAPVMVGATLEDCKFENIHSFGGRYAFVSMGVKMKDVKVDGVFVYDKPAHLPLRFERVPYTGNDIEFSVYERDEDYLENVTFDNVVCENRKLNIAIKENYKNGFRLEGKKL